jgi:hypothetical protein
MSLTANLNTVLYELERMGAIHLSIRSLDGLTFAEINCVKTS